MIPRVSVIVLPALSVLLLFGWPAPAAADADEAALRGLQYLLEHQLPVGGWVTAQHGLTSTGHKLAITSAAAHAVVATAETEESLAAAERAIGFLSRYAGELREPRLTAGFDYTPWAAAYGLVHLHGLQRLWPADRKPPAVADLVETFREFAVRTQRPCGGWDYRVIGASGARLADGSVPFLTAVMLDGLRAWDIAPETRRRAAEDLESLTDMEGLLGYSHEGAYREVKAAPWWSPKEAVGRTLQARLVLARCGRADDAALRSAVARFLEVRAEYAAVRHEPDHAKPHEIAGYYYYHACFHAMAALRYLLDRNPEAEQETLEQGGKLVATLLTEQAEDGSWEDAPAGGKPYGTALALLTLREWRDIRVRWFTDLPAAEEHARKTGRPVVLLFADDNDASRRMVRLFYEAELASLLRKVVLVRLDRRSNSDLAIKAKVYRGPAMLVLDPRLENPLKSPLKKLIGGRDAEKVRAVLEKALGG